MKITAVGTIVLSVLFAGAANNSRLLAPRQDPVCPAPPANDIPIRLSGAPDGADPTCIYVSDYRAAVLYSSEELVVDTNGLTRQVGPGAEWIAIDVHDRDYVLRKVEGGMILLEDIDTLESWELSVAESAKFFRFDMDTTIAAPRHFSLLGSPNFKYAIIRNGVPEIRTGTININNGELLADVQGVVWEGNAVWALVRVKDSANKGYLRIWNLDDPSAAMRGYLCQATIYDVASGHGEVYALEAGSKVLGLSTVIPENDVYAFSAWLYNKEPKFLEGCGNFVYATDPTGHIQYTNREMRDGQDYWKPPSAYATEVSGMAMSGLDFYTSHHDDELHLIRATGNTPEPISTTHPEHHWGGCPTLVQMEIDLAHEVNKYREENGLPAVPLSFSLTQTAWHHMKNQLDEPPIGAQCNLHSWLALCPVSAPCDMCCYSGYESDCINLKPSTITNGAFPHKGFENSFATLGFDFPSAEFILENWKSSPGHNALILNLDTWEGWVWKSMGVGLNTGDEGPYHFANLWFSDFEDPQGYCDMEGGGPTSDPGATYPVSTMGSTTSAAGPVAAAGVALLGVVMAVSL